MSFPSPPQNLDEWTIDILNELIRHPSVESETFDFKSKEMGELDQSICAMANTSGGVLVLGISENTNPKTKHLINFRKGGFNKGEENGLNNKIGTHIYRIEPVPIVKTRVLDDTDGTFFMLIRTEPVISNRPYVLKGKGQCYIRVGSTNQPASRETIINLCKMTIDRTMNIGILANTATMLKEQLLYIDKQATTISGSRESSTYLPEIELDSFRQAVVISLWFMFENDLITPNLVDGPARRHGLYTLINNLQELNSAIKKFNMEEMNAGSRHGVFTRYYVPWRGQNFQDMIRYLDRLRSTTKDFLSHT